MSESDLVLAHIIVNRYFSILNDRGFENVVTEKKAVDLLCHIHKNCCSLNLEMFSIASEYYFIRCVIGIFSNYDINKNEFEHGFWPRYAIEHRCDPGCEH